MPRCVEDILSLSMEVVKGEGLGVTSGKLYKSWIFKLMGQRVVDFHVFVVFSGGPIEGSWSPEREEGYPLIRRISKRLLLDTPKEFSILVDRPSGMMMFASWASKTNPLSLKDKGKSIVDAWESSTMTLKIELPSHFIKSDTSGRKEIFLAMEGFIRLYNRKRFAETLIDDLEIKLLGFPSW